MLQIIQQARRNVRSTLLVAALLGLPACSGGGPTEPHTGGKVAGTYVLQEVEDDELPATIHRGAFLDPNTGVFYNNYVIEVREGYMELREDETFYIAWQVRITADGQQGGGTVDAEGVWDEVPDGVILRIQWPFVATVKLERRDDGVGYHTDLDIFGLGEDTHYDWDLFKR